MQEVLRVSVPAGGELQAASAFYDTELPRVRAHLTRLREQSAAAALLVCFIDPAQERVSAQHGWRLAAIQQLARDYAPLRVNGLQENGGAGANDAAVDETAEWLQGASGITGQLFTLG
ncbi:Rossmann fold domain-containing protein [Altericroceibacterium endophyticum]|uniref:Short chain dehydrogenase-like proteobacteria domain-containing protein n=1 Tax=Altericroceibacterium endophyticum TaxID=1808508 RepID=A0A6I4T7Z5_9SPHN|nr:hypothetical protein [Altericroceibacterium endophyticum]MXO66907.1 hypothetical protein [Altericroceibacterium endophyticum]